MMPRAIFNFRIIFSVCLVLAFAYSAYDALSFAYLAKIFPLYISLALFILSILNLLQEIRAVSSNTIEKSEGVSDLETQWDIPMTDVWVKFLLYVGFILILYGCIWVIGYPLSITFFIILFYRYITKTKLIGAFIAGAAGLGFLALASRLLNMNWPEGLIKLPWPLG